MCSGSLLHLCNPLRLYVIMVTEMLVGRRVVLLRIVKATKSFDKNKENLVVNGKIK